MDHYIDIRLRPDPETPPTALMQTLFGKLHRALVHLHSEDIGVSFPEFDTRRRWLGTVLRLHGREERMATMAELSWLQGMQDQVIAKPPMSAPSVSTHRMVRRVQAHSNAERIRRRQMRRQNWTHAEALQHIPDTVERRLELPFVRLQSSSTGQAFALHIEQLPEQPNPVPGRFSAYGLSLEATVPWF